MESKLSYPYGRVSIVEDRLERLSEASLWVMSPEQVVAGLDEAHAVLMEAQAVFLRYARQVDLLRCASKASASSTAVWMRDRHRVSIGSAHRWVRLAKRVDAAPDVVGAAVAEGRMNLDQADVVTRAVARIPGEVGVDVREAAAAELVRLCAELDPEYLEQVGDRILSIVAPEVADDLDRKAMEHEAARAERERYFTMTPDGVGVRLRGRLTAEGAAIVQAAIDPLCSPTSQDDRSPEQRRADALVAVCTLALATTKLPRNGGDRPQVMLGVDFDTLTRQLRAGRLSNGERITPAAARRMACDARICPIVFDGPGRPVDLGRSRRLVTGPIRTALVARDRGCAFPSCDRDARWAEGHHVTHWSLGGPTCLDNLVLLCGYHHAQIHKADGWKVFIAPDGFPTFIPPPHVDPEQRPRRSRYHPRP
jgi:hypothetical protein